MTLFYNGIAGYRGYAPTKIVIHNDAGSANATANFYREWLPNRNAENGFAHDYVASDGILHFEDYMNCAWHCANAVGNSDYIGIEVCQQLGDLDTFLANEQKAFKLAADLCKRFNIAVTVANFPLHQELSSTNCPARSLIIHGNARQALKEYYVSQVLKYMTDDTEEVEQPKIEEEEDMTEFAFAFKGAMYYVTGSRMVALASANEWAVVQSMYAQTHNGKGILALDWSGNDATADAYFNICGRADDATFKQATTQGIEDIKAALK